MASFYHVAKSLTSLTPVFDHKLCCFLFPSHKHSQDMLYLSPDHFFPLLPMRWTCFSHFSHCCTLFHSLESLHSFSTISHSHHNFSQLQNSVVYVCITLLLCIAIAHCFSSITTVFPDVIMHRNAVCSLSLELLSFLTDIFFFYGHFM